MITKKQKRTRNRRRLMMVVFGVLILVAGVLVFLVMREINAPADDAAKNESQSSENDGINHDAPSDDGDDTSSGTSLPVVEPDKDVQHDTPSTGDELSVWTTIASVSGDTLLIRIQIDQNIGSGTCELKIGDYTETVPVAAQPQSASCDGFDVPTSAYSGDEFRVLVRSGDKSGSVEGKING